MGHNRRLKPLCTHCGDTFAAARRRAGYHLCLMCGEEQAREDRQSWCVAPMHKSNYLLITDRADLLGINNKGGLVK
jgi:predicted RNA-binding Zn-ribbon protein involved in translation (DUF1610 family)